MSNKVDRVLEIADSFEAGETPVSMTEVGDDAFEYWLPPNRQENEVQMALGVRKVLEECEINEVPVCIVYRAQEQQLIPTQSFGLFRFDGSSRPAWAEFLDFVP